MNRNLEQYKIHFAETIKNSDNLFLQDFSKYLKNELEENDKFQILDSFLYKTWMAFELKINGRNQHCGGCGLLGETPFNKLDFVIEFVKILRCKKYEIIDCQGRNEFSKVVKLIKKNYEDTGIIIYTNCEKFLSNDETFLFYKHIAENKGYNGIEDNPVHIFLGDTYTLHNAIKGDFADNIKTHKETFEQMYNIFIFK